LITGIYVNNGFTNGFTLTAGSQCDNVIWVFSIVSFRLNGDLMKRRCRKMRVNITLACTVCRSRNYALTKNKSKHPDRMELRKYCPRCNSHQIHRETK
jgi:large subunit ribosomal protein L33